MTAGRRLFPTLTGVYGVLRLHDGALEFVPEGSPAALWRVPASTVTVTQRGYFASSDLSLNSPETGELGVTVSRDRISRFLGSETRERPASLRRRVPRGPRPLRRHPQVTAARVR